MQPVDRHPSSYRDPSGFLFFQNGVLYRQVNKVFGAHFHQFISGGFYGHLVNKGMLIPHETVNENLTGQEDWFETLRPEALRMISYPYEWCFDMLKDAALLTLEAATEGMSFGMMLKDASAYNVQWHKGRMTFIDTLSFSKYDPAAPWIAYRQFCEHFLAPLALMHYRKLPLQSLLLAYPDGIPLLLAKSLLPGSSRFRLHTYLHLHLHASLTGKGGGQKKEAPAFSANRLKNLIKSLGEAVRSYSLSTRSGVWSGYYGEAFQRADYVAQKKTVIAGWVDQHAFKSAIDVGANEGEFSAVLAQRGIETISADGDHYSVNRLYNRQKEANQAKILPLVIDFTHPSPAIGVNLDERASFQQRVDCDLVMALALVHHLGIGKNIPFEDMARSFRSLGRTLIVEYVPKEDEKIRFMLEQKEDIYTWYSKERFLEAFALYYKVVASEEAGTSGRTLYLMQPHEA